MNCRTIASAVLAIVSLAAAAPAQQTDLPSKFIKNCEYFLGAWATEAEVEGTVYQGKWTVEWSSDKTCLVTHWAGNTSRGPSRSTRIQGWDSLNDKLLVASFSTNGAHTIERYELISDEVNEGEITGVDPDGKPRKATARTVMKSPDFFTWTVKEDGQTVVSKFTRVKK